MSKVKAEAPAPGPALAAPSPGIDRPPISAARPRPGRATGPGTVGLRPAAGGAMPRAQQSAGLQRMVGNARTNQMLTGGPGGGVGASSPPMMTGVTKSQPSGADRLIQRKCACGGDAGPGGECASCRDKRTGVQRRATGAAPSSVPPSVQRAMQSGGQPMGASTRSSMEQGFGTDLGGVRVHTGRDAAVAARDLRADAFTTGQDIYFGEGKYQPGTRDGQRLLAHELTHTVQQRGTGPDSVARMRVSEPGDRQEQEAESISRRVVSGERIDQFPTATGGIPQVQRYSWDEFVDDAAAVGDAVSDTASAAAGAVADTASAAAGAVADTASAAAGVVADTASAAAGAVGEGVTTAATAVAAAANTAVSFLQTEAGQLALAGAQALADTFGGTARIVGTGIVVTIPDMDLCTPQSIPLIELPMINHLVPLWGWGGVFGPIGIGAAAGLRFGVQPSLAASYGPCVLRNMSLLLDPLRGTYAGTAELYVAGAVTQTTRLEAALKAIGVIGLFTPPIALMAGVEGGLRGTLRVIGAGGLQETVRVAYTGGAFSLDLNTALKIGASVEFALDFFANASLYDFVVCEYVLALLEGTLGSVAGQFDLPINITGRGVTVGPITSKPIPFTDIEAYVNRTRPESRCLSLEDIRNQLCKRGYLPDFLCPKEDESGIQRNQLAMAICKCVGDSECGGGRIYRFCFYVDDNTCRDHGKLQKAADDKCNNGPGMSNRCRRPKCYFRHTDAKCPVKPDECEGYFGGQDVGPAASDECAVPTNLRQTSASNAGGGTLHFEYEFDSSSGNLNDLRDCEVGEKVDYPNGDPFIWPNPPWDSDRTPGKHVDNPTIIWLPAARGRFVDNHSTLGFKKPYKRASFRADQVYRYHCPCKNKDNPVAMSRNIPISRAVTQKPNGNFKYRITKSGSAAEVDPLP